MLPVCGILAILLATIRPYYVERQSTSLVSLDSSCIPSRHEPFLLLPVRARTCNIRTSKYFRMRRSIEFWLSVLTTLHLITWSHVTVLYLLLVYSVYSTALISRPIDCPPNSRASRETSSDPLICGVPVGFVLMTHFYPKSIQKRAATCR
ncbi:hypothetical protein EV421DRAFT_1276478 [Armillaria borealis]|uniref:Uncharacterized protein n=1 Tax=Armillaria borealis TaxID=47425 RepID=A0AA39J291_9AGAR|nr:hypothetical protein EV421DRAFT_1276478 [Armillaria borealis]